MPNSACTKPRQASLLAFNNEVARARWRSKPRHSALLFTAVLLYCQIRVDKVEGMELDTVSEYAWVEPINLNFRLRIHRRSEQEQEALSLIRYSLLLVVVLNTDT